MQPGALRALEFDRIVEAVKTFALTPMGAERVSRLQPSTDPRQRAREGLIHVLFNHNDFVTVR